MDGKAHDHSLGVRLVCDEAMIGFDLDREDHRFAATVGIDESNPDPVDSSINLRFTVYLDRDGDGRPAVSERVAAEEAQFERPGPIDVRLGPAPRLIPRIEMLTGVCPQSYGVWGDARIYP